LGLYSTEITSIAKTKRAKEPKKSEIVSENKLQKIKEKKTYLHFKLSEGYKEKH
jgi:hypothetical protein